MGYSIIYDRRSVKLKDGTYILMMQTGSNNCTEFVNGREVSEKYWIGLHLTNEKAGEISCSLEQMKARIAEFSTAWDYIAKSRGNFFQSEEELRKYMEGGLKRPFTFDEYKSAGNTFQVSCWDKAQHKIVWRYVYSEEEMSATIKEFVSNPDYECVNVKFSGRELSPVKSYGHRQPRGKATHGYTICATDTRGNKMFYKKKTPRQLRFTAVPGNARLFGKREQAQKYLDSLPAVKADVRFSIEEYNLNENQNRHETHSQNTAEAE